MPINNQLETWKDTTEIYDDEGCIIGEKEVWYCTDGISTYFGDTEDEAMSHFGVVIG